MSRRAPTTESAMPSLTAAPSKCPTLLQTLPAPAAAVRGAAPACAAARRPPSRQLRHRRRPLRPRRRSCTRRRPGPARARPRRAAARRPQRPPARACRSRATHQSAAPGTPAGRAPPRRPGLRCARARLAPRRPGLVLAEAGRHGSCRHEPTHHSHEHQYKRTAAAPLHACHGMLNSRPSLAAAH